MNNGAKRPTVFLATGTMPSTLIPLFASRVQGEQNINRAELSAIVTAAALPYGFIHSDSAYAITKVHEITSGAIRLFAQSNADLLHDLQDIRLCPRRVCKIKAHQDLRTVSCLLELYHLLGNETADVAAKSACTSLDKPWYDDLVAHHKQIQMERDVLADVFGLHNALAIARAKLDEQRHRQESEVVPVPAKASVDPILPAIQTWMPTEVQELEFPDSRDWFRWFAWGPTLAEQFYIWMQLLVWPSQPQGPFAKEMGISWLELGLSFSMFLRKALPILRNNSENKTRLLMIEDEQDLVHHSVTLQDVAATFQRMWAQSQSLLPTTAFPQCQKGLQPSLYIQGMKQYIWVVFAAEV